jgi:hypothetical protein
MKSFISWLAVIAVMLILAAILFPVFAQSKESAKKTAALSALKQARANADGLEASGEGGFQPVSRQSVKSLMQDRMVIRTAEMTVRVASVEKAELAVNRIVASHGGYINDATSSDLASDHPVMTITMRVPVESFDKIMSGIEALGVRLSKSIRAKDVTEEVVDLDARMKTMAIQEETFRGLLKNARDLDSVISLQDKLAVIRSEIESLLAQRTSLAKQASFSTITLTLEQAAVGAGPPSDPNWLAQAWGESSSSMGAFIRSFTVFLIWAIVFSPVWIPLGLVGLKVARANMPRRVEAEA